jgi:hypothetical protein
VLCLYLPISCASCVLAVTLLSKRWDQRSCAGVRRLLRCSPSSAAAWPMARRPCSDRRGVARSACYYCHTSTKYDGSTCS